MRALAFRCVPFVACLLAACSGSVDDATAARPPRAPTLSAPPAEIVPVESATPAASTARPVRALVPPTASEIEALRTQRLSDQVPVVRIARRGRARLAADGPEVGGRPAAAWSGFGEFYRVLENGDRSSRCVVGFDALNQKDLERSRALQGQPQGGVQRVHTVGIEEQLRFLVWVENTDLEPLLREAVELRPSRREMSAPRGWDARVFVDAGTRFEVGAATETEQEVRVVVSGGAVSGWIDRDSIHHVLDRRRDEKPPVFATRGTEMLDGTLLSRPGGEVLLTVNEDGVEVLARQRGWARVRYRDFGVTIFGWVAAKDLSSPDGFGLGGRGMGVGGASFEDGLDDRAGLAEHVLPQGTLLRDPRTSAVIGVARMETLVGRDEAGLLWAPSPWGPIQVAVFPEEPLALE